MSSENGWEPARVGPDALDWITVPGTNVKLQMLKGPALTIMRAYAADFNAYIEPLRDADSACWTPTNSVATSNHLNATAMDLNWESHRFHVAFDGFDDAKTQRMRDLLAFYEDTMFWAEDWDDPKDCMHHQMGYGTYGNPRLGDFIARKVRADGFSTYQRGNAPVPPPLQVPLSRSDRYAQQIIAEGQRRGITPRGIQIALATGLVESNIQVYANERVPESMSIPHDAVGSDAFSVGIFQQQVRDTGGGWWWGDAATCMDPTSSAGLFYDRLAKLDYNGGNSPGSYAQAVQSSAFPDRYDQRMDDAVAIYDRLATQTPQQGEDDLTPEQDAMLRDIHREQTQQLASRSPLRHLGEGLVDTVAGFDLNIDAHGHLLRIVEQGSLGHPESLALLREVAGADPQQYPDRQDDAKLAQAILASYGGVPSPRAVVAAPSAGVDNTRELADAYAKINQLQAENSQLRQAAAQQQPVPAPAAALIPAANGDLAPAIANLYTSLKSLHLADALPIEERAPLAATINVLQTKNGSQI